MKYIGQTERGRVVREDTLEACIDSLAFVANKERAPIVVEKIEITSTGDVLWYVYHSQASCDADKAARTFGSRDNWFAVITMERK